MRLKRPDARTPARLRWLPADRTVNFLLLWTVLALALTGVAGLFANAAGQRIVFQLHRAGGAVLLVLLVPKAGIVARSLRRRLRAGVGGRAAFPLLVSLLLLVVTLVVIAAALGWSLARGPWRGEWGLPLIVVHWYLALGALPLVLLHVIGRWRRAMAPRAADFAGRRRLLTLGAGAALAFVAWRAVERGAGSAESRAGRRRFTGSREADWGAPNAFFVTQFLTDDPGDNNPAPIAPEAWSLRVTGRVERPLTLRYGDVLGDSAVTATVDCTGGVYATREWRGAPVGQILDAAGIAPRATLVWFVSRTGYRWPLPLEEARRALLATHVGGEPLSHEHGFPLRLVAPERRGFQWIKWLDAIEVL